MNFVGHAFWAILVVLAGALLSSGIFVIPGAGGWTRFGFGFAALLAEMWLFISALYIRAKSAGRFDMAVAAETIVALGVFSLITGIVIAVGALPRAHVTVGGTTLVEFEPLLIPFGEGLLASAVAPLLATILRQVEVLKYGPHPGADSTDEQLGRLTEATTEATEAMSKLATQGETATKNVAAFAEAAKAVVDRLRVVAQNIEDAKSKVPDAITAAASAIRDRNNEIPTSLSASADAIRMSVSVVPGALGETAAAIRTAAGQVPASLTDTAGKIRISGDGVSGALSRTSTALDDFAGKAKEGAEAAKRTATEFDNLSKQAEKTTGILTRLQELVDRVTDFIRPEKT